MQLCIHSHPTDEARASRSTSRIGFSPRGSLRRFHTFLSPGSNEMFKDSRFTSVAQCHGRGRGLPNMFYRFIKSAMIFLSLTSVFCSYTQRPPAQYKYAGKLSFNISDVPFSRYGSYLTFSAVPNQANAQVLPGPRLHTDVQRLSDLCPSVVGGGNQVSR